MPTLSDDDLKQLSDLIVQNIKKDFANKHMSKNLINTIQVEKTNDGIAIIIPAQAYNMKLFQQKGVVLHTSHGSYASKLNDVGSEFFVYPNESRKGSYKSTPHNHIGYADNAVNSAIELWTSMMQEKYNISKKEL